MFPRARVVVVVPTYNEFDTLPELVGRLVDLDVPELMILVVDDCSPDGTGELAEDLAGVGWPVAVVHRPGKEGLGRAYVAGISHALELGAEIVVQMDADLSHPPAAVPALLRELENASVTVGSRYVEGGSVDLQWPWSRRMLSRGANWYLDAVLGLGVRDVTAGFKAWRSDALRMIDLNSVASTGYAFQIEMAFHAQRSGVRVVEVPIHFAERASGTSKMTLRVQAEAAVLPWRLRRRPALAHPAERVPAAPR